MEIADLVQIGVCLAGLVVVNNRNLNQPLEHRLHRRHSHLQEGSGWAVTKKKVVKLNKLVVHLQVLLLDVMGTKPSLEKPKSTGLIALTPLADEV